MKKWIISGVFAFGLIGAAAAQAARNSHGQVLQPSSNERRTEAAFKGTDVQLDLGIGDFDVVPRAGDKVVIAWWGKTANEAHAKIDVQGSHVVVSAGSDRRHDADVHFRIELPKRADISADAKVGEVKISGFDGSLDAQLNVGDLQVAVKNSGEYGVVKASAGIGDVEPGPFGSEAKRSHLVGAKLDYHGSGSRHLKLHVGTGDVKIQEGGSGETI